MTDHPPGWGNLQRRPLQLPTPEKLAELRAKYGVGQDNLPLGLTNEEKKAAANPGMPDTQWRPHMETKPGIKTTEFWLKLGAGALIAVLAFTMDKSLPAITEQLPTLGWVGAVLALAAPLAKAGLGWALHKLSETYSQDRTAAKTAANDNSETVTANVKVG